MLYLVVDDSVGSVSSSLSGGEDGDEIESAETCVAKTSEYEGSEIA